jgi:hypothetical protein
MFIQNLLFGAGDLQVIQGGYNSDVFLVSHSRQIVVKVVGGKKGINLDPYSAAQLGQQVSHYRHLLKDVGVPVPGFLEWAVSEDSASNHTYLFLVEPFSGPNPVSVLQNGDGQKKLWVVNGILEALRPLLSSSQQLEVGIDPKTNNFVLGSGVTYVDFMPPRFRMPDGAYLVEYPNLTQASQLEVWRWKYFTPEGIAHVALNQLGRVVPESFQEVKGVILKWLRAHRCTYVHDRLETLLHSNVTVRIEESDNLYELRLLACELASRSNAASQGAVEDFFIGTHYEGEPSAEMLAWAKGRLRVFASAVC